MFTINRSSTATVQFATPQEVVINQADDSIRAYVYDSAGNGISSTLNGGKQSLDINVTNLSAGSIPINDAGGSLTVDGTVAATQSGTWNIGTLSTITNVVHVDDNAGSLTVDGTVAATQSGTWNITNISGTVSLPTGASTAANQTTANTSLSVLETATRERRTYSATITGLTIAAAATDIFTITGAVGVTTRVNYITFAGEANAALVTELILIKRSTANSAGTSTTRTAVPHNSGDAAASSTVRAYTTNPTLGTAIGEIRTRKVQISGANTMPAETIEWVFDKRTTKPPTLLSTSEVLAINFNAVTSAGSTFCITISWTEE